MTLSEQSEKPEEFTEHSNMHYVYLIKNTKDNSTYIGYTSNLKRRLQEHRDRNPNLIYYEAYKHREDAQNRERKLKQRGQAIRWLKSRLKQSLQL